MDKNYLKMGPHDVGGEESLPIDTTDNNMTHWEKYANALRIVVSSKRIITLDELRYHTEALGDQYFEIGYFERNCLSLHNICIQKGIYDMELFQKIKSKKISEFDVPGVEEELGLDFDGSHVTRALEELPDSYSEALKLKFVDELGYSKLAEATGVSEQNARARVSRARSAMRSALRGVAVLPALLFGLLRRGEKAAAAGVPAAREGAATAGRRWTSC